MGFIVDYRVFFLRYSLLGLTDLSQVEQKLI